MTTLFGRKKETEQAKHGGVVPVLFDKFDKQYKILENMILAKQPTSKTSANAKNSKKITTTDEDDDV